MDLDDVPAHAEGPAPEIVIVALVKDIHQTGDDLVARNLLTLYQHEQHAVVGLGRPETVNAAYAGHDDAVAPLEKRPRRREPQLIQLVVDGGFFFDADVARWNVRFRLVIIVVADEVFDRVRRK